MNGDNELVVAANDAPNYFDKYLPTPQPAEPAPPIATPAPATPAADGGANHFDKYLPPAAAASASAGGGAPAAGRQTGWGQALGHELGVLGSGIAHGVASPVDLVSLAVNKAPGLVNYLAEPFAKLDLPDLKLPYLGTAGADWVGNQFGGWAQPQNVPERLLYGAGAGIGAGAVGGLPGALSGVARSAIAPTALTAARAAVPAAVSGAAGQEGYDLASGVTDDPGLRSLAAILAGGGSAVALKKAGDFAGAVRELGQPNQLERQKDLAGQILNESAVTTTPAQAVAAAARPQPTGIAPSLADATNDPGLQLFKQQLDSSSPQAGGERAISASDNNQALHHAIDTQIGKLPPNLTQGQLSAGGAADLARIAAEQKQQAQALYTKLPLDQTMIDTQPLLDNYNAHIMSIPAAHRLDVPQTYADLLHGYDPQVPLSELQAFSSRLNSEATQAFRSGDANKGRVLLGVHDAVFGGSGQGPEDLVTGTTGADLAAANQNYATYKKTYQKAPLNSPQQQAVKTVNNLVTGLTPPSSAFDTIFSSGKGQAERAQAFFDAAQGDPDLLQSARNYIAEDMRQAASNAPQDQAGNRMLSGAKLSNWYNANQDLINSPIFSDAHRQAFQDIVAGAQEIERTGRAGAYGSPTYRLFASARPTDTMQAMGLSPLAQTLATKGPMAVGGALGMAVGALAQRYMPLASHLFEGGGTVGGAYLGAKLAPSVNFDTARRNVLGFVRQGMNDADLGAQLMTRPGAAPVPAAASADLASALATPPPPPLLRRFAGNLVSQMANPAAAVALPGRLGWRVAESPAARGAVRGGLAAFVGPPATSSPSLGFRIVK